MTVPVELRAGDLRLSLRADLGASVAGLWCGDLPVTRSVEPAELGGARLSGCYPLVPWSNRLGQRRFRWLGRDHVLSAPGDGPHAIHGVGWLHAWDLVSSSDTEAVMAYTHPGDEYWPFAFKVTQRYLLTPGAMRVELSLRNDAPHAAPAGLGWHPYFPKRQRSRMHIELTDRWEHDATQLPTRRVPQPGIDGDVAHLDFDHCFEGWQGGARIRDEKMSLRVTSSLPYLVVFTPPNRDIFAVEPVSHVTNAIHMADPAAHGLRTLAPGASFDAWMQFDVSRVG